MDNTTRLLATLSELSIGELRLVLWFAEFLVKEQAKKSGT